MGPSGTELDDQPTPDSTPEDVAALYSWANLQGAKYRDYSASRREYRAQVRYRAARAMLERELKAQVEAEAAAVRGERTAGAESSATSQDGSGGTINQTRGTDEADRLAAAERVEAARRTESATRAAVLAFREEREIAEAHSSAKRQAQIYEESELRRRQLAGPQPQWPMSDDSGREVDLRSDRPPNLQQFLFSGGIDPAFEYQSPEPGADVVERVPAPPFDDVQNTPAWLFSGQAIQRPQTGPAMSQVFRADLGDTLQDSRERVASKWFALKDVFHQARPELPALQPFRSRVGQRPLLAVFSLSGGVGKTSLLATLARALCALGERITVVDTTSHGLLPIFFGSDMPGLNQARRSPSMDDGTREPSAGLPITLFAYDVDTRSNGEREQEIFTDQILSSGEANQRLLIDIPTGSSWLIRRLVDLHPTVLVPVAPDMNSVISMQAIERLFRGMVDSEGRPLLPFYVLNQFDAALPLHLDVREVFRRQLGDRLLPYSLQRSPLVSEALAEGMTVFDYAHDARVSQDYQDIANWLRSVSPPATGEHPGRGRGER